MTAAAVAILGLSVVLLDPRPAAIPGGDAGADSARIFSLDFEAGGLAADVRSDGAGQTRVFHGDFESGGLSSWSNPV